MPNAVTSKFRHLDQEDRQQILDRILAHNKVMDEAGLRRQVQLVSSVDATMLSHPNQWNAPGRIKPGRTCRHCPFCERELHVLAVDPVGLCITASPTGDDDFHVVRIEDLGRLTRRSRLSVQENARHILRFLHGLSNHPMIALRWLLAMLHGEMGWQYANLAAEAWTVRAGYVLNRTSSSPELVEWAEYILERASAEDVPRELLPPELEALASIDDPEAQPVFFGPEWTPDEAFDEYMRSIDQVEHHIQNLLNGPELEPPPPEQYDFPLGVVAMCSRNDTEVVVLGDAFLEADPGYFHVLDIEAYETYSVHGSELESEGYELDEDELLQIIDESEDHGPNISLFLADYPWQTVTIPPVIGCLTVVTAFRIASKLGTRPSTIRELYRLARERYGKLSKEDRKYVMALAPEINAPKGGVPTPKGGSGSIGVIVDKMIDDALRQAGVRPAEEAVEQVEPAEPALLQQERPSEPISPPVEPAVSTAVEVETAAAPVPQEKPRPQQAPVVDELPPQVVRSKADRVLRFKVKEHRLLAMEWNLVEGEGTYEQAVSSTLAWLGERLGVSLPDAWASGGHELELGGVRVQLEAGTRIFALRMEHPDRNEVARTWRVEAMLIAGPAGRGGMVGIRVSTQDRADLPAPYTGLPGLVAAWQDSPGLVLGVHSTAVSLQVRTAQEFEAWQSSMKRPRQYMVSVTTDPAGFAPFPTATTVVQRVTMLRDAAGLYEGVYGRPWEGCVHVFAPEDQGPRNWNVAERKGMVALQNAATDLRQRPGTPTFKQLRDMVRDSAAAQPAPTPAPVPPPVIEPAIEPVTADVVEHTAPAPEPTSMLDSAGYRADELQLMLDMALSDHAATQSELDDRRAEVAQLRSKLQALQAQLSIRSDVQPAMEAIPDRLDQLPAWIPSLQPRLVIVDKALRVASRTEHREVAKIYGGLRALATDYWASRFDEDAQAYARWSEFLKDNRMRWGPVGVANDISRYEGEYQAVWEGRTYTMTHHLQGSSSRDPTRCIRIYVAIDEERQVVVVGALPAHLTNTLT